MNYISKHNKEFIRFKDIHAGRDSILFCTGPSLHRFTFKPFSKDTINVGVNRIYNSSEISNSLDYYFFGSHYHIDTEHRNNIHRLRDNNPRAMFLSSTFTAKFGDGRETGLGNINQQASSRIGAFPFECGSPGSGPGEGWVKDIDKHPFYGGSIAFPAVQFLLYTGVKRIYLAGCDLGNSAAHFHNSTSSGVRNDGGSSFYLSAWKKLPEFLKKNYPDAQIISINPVGLNGIFGNLHV